MLLKLKKMFSPRIVFLVHYLRYLLCSPKRKKKILLEFEKQEKDGLDSIPIFLISFNRLSYLKLMIENLEKKNKKNIIVIDNASTYPPLLAYYKQIPYKVIYMEKNGGYKCFWENHAFDEYRKSFYIVSDPDLEILDECPSDFVEEFFRILKKYPFLRKVGFSLKIDDLPRDNKLAMDAYSWEKQFYKHFFKKQNAYYAILDTTFALYSPDSVAPHRFGEAFRKGYPYQVRHLPWYKNQSLITDEDKYYAEHKTNGWWNVVEEKMTPDNMI